MKTKTIFKIVAFCVICTGTMLSGCIGSDDEPTSVTNILEKSPEKPGDDEPVKSGESSSIISDIVDKVSDGDSDEMPFTVTFDYGTIGHLFIFEENGAGEQCISNWEEIECSPMEWERTTDGSYDFLFIGDAPMSITILDDGTAILEAEGSDERREGTWESGVNK